MKAIDFKSAHFLVNGRVTDNLGQLLFELVDVPSYIPYDSSLLLTAHLVLSVNGKITFVSSFYLKWQILERLQRFVYVEVLVFLENSIRRISLFIYLSLWFDLFLDF